MHRSVMKRAVIFFGFTFVILSACSLFTRRVAPVGDTGTTNRATPTLVSSGAPTIEPTLATLQLAVYPPEARSGMPELDAIIDAVLAHDFEALRRLTDYTRIGCTHVDGSGGPPKCASDEVEDSLVEVVPFLGPQGHHQRRTEYENWSGPDVRGLLAVYRNSSEVYADEAYPAGEYGLAFLEADGASVLTLQVRRGRVVRYDYGSGASLQSDLERLAAQTILPLAFRPIPTAVAWNQFIDAGGRFAFVYPPTMSIRADSHEDSWLLGDRIRIEVLTPNQSWIACFDQALGDCPVVETDERISIHGREVRRVAGWIGAVGGRIPQEFLVYIFDLDEGEVLAFTLYALPFDAELSDVSKVWPLEGVQLELFERTVETVTIYE